MTVRKKLTVDKLKYEKRLLQQELLMHHHVIEGMRKNLSYQNILKLIVLSVTRGLDFDRAGIFLADFEKRLITQVMGIDEKGRFERYVARHSPSSPISPQKGFNIFSDILYGHLKYFFTNNISNRMVRTSQIRTGVTCNANIPIQIGNGKIIGILAVDNLFSQRRLELSDIRSLLNFATQAGLAMESARLHEQVKSQTVTDGLTGSYNRRYFDRKLPEEMKRSFSRKKPLSLLYVDIDHFKSINDRFGHLEGDEVLKRVALLLSLGVRGADTVARIGGEEFAVIMPETAADQALAVAQRLVETVAADVSPVPAIARQGKKVTISAGLACLNHGRKETRPLHLMKKADQSLYQAKESGRNRVGPLLTAG